MPVKGLNLHVPRDLMENAKRYAAQNNTTLSSMIEAYLRRIPARCHWKTSRLSAA